MYRLFEIKSIFAYLILVFLVILLGIKVFMTGDLVLDNNGSFVFTYILKTHLWHPNFLRVLIFICALVSFFVFTLIFKEFSYQSKSGLLAVFVFSINSIVSISLPFNLESIIGSNLFLVLSFLVLKLEKEKDTTSSFYNLGFLIVVSSLVTNYMLFYLLPLFFTLFIYGSSGLRDFLAMLVGIATPIVLIGSIILLQNNWKLLALIVDIARQIHYMFLTSWDWFILGLTVIAFILALPIINSFTISTRKYYTYLVFCFLGLIPAYIFISISGKKPYVLVMTISSFYILPLILKTSSGLFKNLLLILGIIGAIFATFVQFK